jgi:hypothetical protein
VFGTALPAAVRPESTHNYFTILISLKYSLNWEYKNPNYSPLKIVATKVTVVFKHFYSNVQSCYQKLTLNVLIHIVESCNVGCAVADHQIHFVSIESLVDFFECFISRDIANNVMNVLNWAISRKSTDTILSP